jgi:hypothetical protein
MLLAVFFAANDTGSASRFFLSSHYGSKLVKVGFFDIGLGTPSCIVLLGGALIGWPTTTKVTIWLPFRPAQA